MGTLKDGPKIKGYDYDQLLEMADRKGCHPLEDRQYIARASLLRQEIAPLSQAAWQAQWTRAR